MAVVKVWGRGQLTIPATLRKELHLDEETTLNVVKVGDALILTPKKNIGRCLGKKSPKGNEESRSHAERSPEGFRETAGTVQPGTVWSVGAGGYFWIPAP